MKQFIGIYQDAEPNKKVEVVSFSFSTNTKRLDHSAPKKTGVAIFSAETLIEAMQKAKEMGYSSFAEISGRIFYENHDY